MNGLRQKTKHHGKVYGDATPAEQTGKLVLIPTKQKSFIARKRIAAIMVISEPHEGSSFPQAQQIQAARLRYLPD